MNHNTIFNIEPKISCIMIFFNERDLIEESIRSVLSQTYSNFELVIVDDGSTDDTASYVDKFSDPRIVRIRQSNDGPSSARNRGIAHATGDYICFLDADDTRPPWAFKSIADAIAQSSADVIFCRGLLSEIRGDLLPFYDAHLFDVLRSEWSRGRLTGSLSQAERDELFALAHLLEPQPANKVVRTEFLRRNRLHFPNTHFFEDMFFHTACLMAAGRIDFVDDECFTYFRRYIKKQTTSRVGEVRFDAIAVGKLILETFACSVQFASPLPRTAVLGSIMRIVSWCESSISHNYRYDYAQTLKGVFRAVDPVYRSIPYDLPSFFDSVRPSLEYAKRHFT